MERRELYKKLKEKKVFGRFCLVVATSYTREYYREPRNSFENYLHAIGVESDEKHTLFPQGEDFIRNVVKWDTQEFRNVKVMY